MHHFDYRHGVLHAEGVNLVDLASAVGTPFYCYSTATSSGTTASLRKRSPMCRRWCAMR